MNGFPLATSLDMATSASFPRQNSTLQLRGEENNYTAPRFLIVAIISLSAILIFLETFPVEGTTIDQVSKIGAMGLLAVAVVVLWRKLQEKDALLMQNYKSMAEALATNKAVVEKMSETLGQIKEAVERMTHRHIVT